jgi:hypothetical protein
MTEIKVMTGHKKGIEISRPCNVKITFPLGNFKCEFINSHGSSKGFPLPLQMPKDGGERNIKWAEISDLNNSFLYIKSSDGIDAEVIVHLSYLS